MNDIEQKALEARHRIASTAELADALKRIAQYQVTFADNPVTVYAAMQQTARAALAKAGGQ
jgi:hypothetical protein